ncbi:MAG: Calx-beta domain-containing protein [Gammaproteobacteria bacterium]
MRSKLSVQGLMTACLCAFLLAGCGGGSSSSSPKTTDLVPYAVNAYFVTSPDMTVSGQLYASNLNNDPMTYSVQDDPTDGTVDVDKDTGVITYTPNSNFTGTDTFTYIATDSAGDSAPAGVTILVNPNPPTVSVFGAPVYVHNGTPTSVDFTVSLSNAPNGQATVNYATSDGTAKAGTDYTATSGTLTFGPGVLSQTIAVQLSGVEAQASRAFTLQLSNPSGNLALGQGTAAAVLRYYPEPLNDTGVTGCATTTNGGPSNPDTCPQSDFPQQDADIGRDPAGIAGTLAKVGSGIFGYDFTLLGNDGKPLFNQSANYAVEPWACVQDNWTGLVWEVPTPVVTAGIFDSGYFYTWYDPNASSNGGSSGKANGGPNKLDTYHFAQAANQYGLCGYHDWRLPSAAEFRNLVNIGAPGTPNGPLPSIPTFEGAGYWTATPEPINAGARAVTISALYGYDSFLPKAGATYVLLVRGGNP